MKNQPVRFRGQRVLTTSVLANLFEVTPSTITQLANNNYKTNKIFCDKAFDELIEGTDYFNITAGLRPIFIDNNRGAFLDVKFRGGKLRVFTKSGTAKIARNLKRLNLYYDRIYGYFSLSDLTDFYIKTKKYFLTKKESARLYRENNSTRLDQIEQSLNILSSKVEEQKKSTIERLSYLESRIDKLLMDKLK